MKVIEQLQEILCTGCESVEKDVKELRFGCRVTPRNCDYTMYVGEFGDEISLVNYQKVGTFQAYNVTRDADLKIIGNPLTLKHLMMYCNEKGIDLSYSHDGSLFKTFVNGYKVVADLDITKDYLYEQEGKVLLDIINFLKG